MDLLPSSPVPTVLQTAKHRSPGPPGRETACPPGSPREGGPFFPGVPGDTTDLPSYTAK